MIYYYILLIVLISGFYYFKLYNCLFIISLLCLFQYILINEIYIDKLVEYHFM